ncbi:MAG: tyrosine-type recombinase/integrase, partial [Lachnospiraceae bacterium]|nr:tyrosine-type recombinase/integrase [Lachnospiraceae bacterium]
LEFGTLKTEASRRTIPLNQTAIKLLHDVCKDQLLSKLKAGSAYEDNGLVFATQLGRPLDPTNMRRTFYSICEKIGLNGLHPHCLRHTFATRGAENDIDVRVMQRFLGHATIQETADTYTHVLTDLKRNEILKLDKAVSY